MNSPILLTGGFGYLGGRIALELVNGGFEGIMLGSRTVRPLPAWLPKALPVIVDLCSPAQLKQAVSGVRTIVHLAAMNEAESQEGPSNSIIVNTVGTVNLLQAALEAGVERFIYLSTAHVYGAPLAGRIDETTPARPIHPYAITHRAAEDFVIAANTLGKINGIVIRLSNGYGYPAHSGIDRWTLLVNDLCRQVVMTGRMVLRSSGQQKRDFVTLKDVGRAVVHLAALSETSCLDGLFNLGGECVMSVWEMARLVAGRSAHVLGVRPEIFRPQPRDDELILPLEYSMEKLKSTGFALVGNLKEEVDGTLQCCSREFRCRD